MTNEEEKNLLILAMKADGFNNELIADGHLGEKAIRAAKIFIEAPEEQKRFYQYITSSVISALITDEKLGLPRMFTTQYVNTAMKKFFTEFGIEL